MLHTVMLHIRNRGAVERALQLNELRSCSDEIIASEALMRLASG
jgi:hypothetical protein